MEIKPKKLNWKSGLLLFGACLLTAILVVTLLRHLLIPKDEMDCYDRIQTLQKAVAGWNAAHPDQPVTEDINEDALVKGGVLQPLSYDHDKHYYFVGETAHGLKVKCNKHEDNPLVLRLTGDALLAVLLFVSFCSLRGYRLFEA